MGKPARNVVLRFNMLNILQTLQYHKHMQSQRFRDPGSHSSAKQCQFFKDLVPKIVPFLSKF